MLNTYYEEEIYGFLYREYGDLGEPSTLLVSLPDVGLVGSIAGAHIVRELGMKDVVGIDSYSAFPPVAVIQGGEPKHPLRIYSDGRISVLLTDIPIPPPVVIPLARSIVEWSMRRGIKTIIGVTGLGNPARLELEKPSIYYLATSKRAEEQLTGIDGIKKMGDGILVGPMAIILKESARLRLNMLMLMADSYIDIPDPEAAARIVEALSKILDIRVGVEKLMKEAELIKLRYKELMKETRNMMAKMGKGYEYRAPLLYT
ncbi:MAG: PAC2 family protein [Desulfurococcales archaeon]|nr:PAC2 family protein [Desulfurococcales archaeon]